MYFRLDTALQSRARKLSEVRSILDAAETRDGKLSRSENARVKAIEADIEALDEKIRAYNAGIGVDEDADTFTRGAALAHRNGAAADDDGVALRSNESLAAWYAKRSGGGFGAAGDGLENEDDIANLSLGQVVRALTIGNRDGLSETARRSLLESVDAQGGYTTPEILGSRLLDRVRNAARVFQAGASTVPLLSDKHSIARLDTGVTPAFRAEGDPIAESAMTFSRVTFNPKFLGVLVKISIELLEDMTPEAHQIIETEMARAIALAVDFNALYGDGTSNAPVGIKHQTAAGVTLTALAAAGASPSYDNFLDAFQVLRGSNFDPNAVIAAPRTHRSLEGLKDTQGRYLDPPQSFKDVPFLTTNQVPVNQDSTDASEHDCSDAFVGQWENLLVGFRPNIQLRTLQLNERYLADEGKVGLMAYVRLDTQVAHGGAFNVLTGIRP